MEGLGITYSVVVRVRVHCYANQGKRPRAAMATPAILLRARLLWRSLGEAGLSCKWSCNHAMPMNVRGRARSRLSTHGRNERNLAPPSTRSISGVTTATRCSSDLGRAPGSDLPLQVQQTTGCSALEKIRLSAEMCSTWQIGQFKSCTDYGARCCDA